MTTYVNNRAAIHQGLNAQIPAPINPVIPKPSGGPPVPILNMAHAPGLENGTATLFIGGNKVSVAGSRFASRIDSPDGLLGLKGVTSFVVAGKAEPTSYSGDTKIESRGSVRALDTTKSNSMLLDPGMAARAVQQLSAISMTSVMGKVADRLPGAFEDQLKSMGQAMTNPSTYIGPALMVLGKLIPGIGWFMGGAQAVQTAMDLKDLMAEVEEMMLDPNFTEDDIADYIANGIANSVLNRLMRIKAKRPPRRVSKRLDGKTRANAPAVILAPVAPAKPAAPTKPENECQTCKPVIFSTGVKIIDESDFSLPGLVPLEWTRFYRSSDRRPGWLGFGWSTPFSVELALVFDGIRFYDHKGRMVELPLVERGQSHFNAREGVTLHHTAQGRFILAFNDGLTYEFAQAVPGQWRLPLVRMADRHHNAITIHYPAYSSVDIHSEVPRPVGITDSAGRKLELVWHNQLLQEVRLAPQFIDGEHRTGGTLVRYTFDTAGNQKEDLEPNLVAVTDAMGGATTYRYQNHLMVSYTTKNGFSHHQEWSRMDAGGRVIRTWTDTPGLLDTRFEYDLGMRVTHVTDALGRRTSYHYNLHNEVTQVDETDSAGAHISTRTEMDANGNPTQSADAMGRQTRYQFDPQGNLVSVTDAAGATSAFKYNALNLPTEVMDALGNVWRNTFDEQGNLQRQTDPLNQLTQYQYDPRGLPTHITDALGKTKLLAWDSQGQLMAYTDCSGQTTKYSYDILGNIQTSTDALGHTTRYQHDALGRMTLVTQADGATHRYQYDASDNLSQYTDPLGAITRYRYNGLDQPIERTDALGHTLRYAYDPIGRLVALQNENHAQYHFQYDWADNLIQETGFDGRLQRYHYNAAGELTELHELSQTNEDFAADPRAPLSKQTHFERDPLGRLLHKAQAEEHSSYTYDLLGRMLSANNTDAEVRFVYDALSQLITEEQIHEGADLSQTLHFKFSHLYDALGTRTQTTLPSQKHINWLHYGSGHLHQIRVNDYVVCDMERDAVHREIARSQGHISSHFDLDPMGRLTAHKLSRNKADPQASFDKGRTPNLPPLPNLVSGPISKSHPAIHRQFQYDVAGNLAHVNDALRGNTHYRYDPLSRILGAQTAQTTEVFAFDPASNLLNPNRGQQGSAGGASAERERVIDNRLSTYQDLRFEYDVHGNVTERRKGWHTVQQFKHNADHQIVEATVTRYQVKTADGRISSPVTQTTRYRYDPLGRRIDKTDAFGRTSFVYDGDLLTAEIRGAKLSEYLYESDSFVPLAKLESQANGIGKADPKELKRISSWDDALEIALPLMNGEDAEKEQEQEASNDQHFEVYYYHCDQIGAPQELTNSQGEIVWAASYKVWGEVEQLEFLKTGTDDQPLKVFSHNNRPLTVARAGNIQALNFIEQPLRFQGQYADHETGLHYNRFRYYDPIVGRFVHQDPIGLAGGINLLQFAPNPIGWTDPFGLRAVWDTRLMRGMTRNKNKVAHQDRHVYQDNKAFKQSDSNLCAMLKGNAPVGNDGKPINLHHIDGQEPGAMLEMQQSIHQKITKNLHFFIDSSFRNDPDAKRHFENFKKDYWKTRARDILKSRCK